MSVSKGKEHSRESRFGTQKTDRGKRGTKNGFKGARRGPQGNWHCSHPVRKGGAIPEGLFNGVGWKHIKTNEERKDSVRERY